jgi:hypothetical protein
VSLSLGAILSVQCCLVFPRLKPLIIRLKMRQFAIAPVRTQSLHCRPLLPYRVIALGVSVRTSRQSGACGPQ